MHIAPFESVQWQVHWQIADVIYSSSMPLFLSFLSVLFSALIQAKAGCFFWGCRNICRVLMWGLAFPFTRNAKAITEIFLSPLLCAEGDATSNYWRSRYKPSRLFFFLKSYGAHAALLKAHACTQTDIQQIYTLVHGTLMLVLKHFGWCVTHLIFADWSLYPKGSLLCRLNKLQGRFKGNVLYIILYRTKNTLFIHVKGSVEKRFTHSSVVWWTYSS